MQPFKCKLLNSMFICYCLLCCGKVILTFKSVDETLVCDHPNERYFHVVLFIILYKVILSFQSVDETLVYNHPCCILLFVLQYFGK